MRNNPTDIRIGAGDGSYVVREKGGRIAELEPGPDLGNVFFDGLDAIDGGDRMWIAPEVELFYDGPPVPEGWRCPPELDPGEWSMERAGDGVELRQTALGAELRREIAPLEGWDPGPGVRWSGYRVVNTVETSRRWSAWQLVMLPTPADISARGGRDTIVYYAPAPAISNGFMRADGSPPRWKVGFEPPRDGDARLVALFDPDPGPVVVIMSRLDPDATYVDVPPEGGRAAALQAFDSPGDGFCELEMHAPLETRRLETIVVAAWGSRSQRMSIVGGSVLP
jgi:hypothetical protein